MTEQDNSNDATYRVELGFGIGAWRFGGSVHHHTEAYSRVLAGIVLRAAVELARVVGDSSRGGGGLALAVTLLPQH